MDKKMKIIIALIVVLVIAVAGVLAFVLSDSTMFSSTNQQDVGVATFQSNSNIQYIPFPESSQGLFVCNGTENGETKVVMTVINWNEFSQTITTGEMDSSTLAGYFMAVSAIRGSTTFNPIDGYNISVIKYQDTISSSDDIFGVNSFIIDNKTTYLTVMHHSNGTEDDWGVDIIIQSTDLNELKRIIDTMKFR